LSAAGITRKSEKPARISSSTA